MLSVYWDWKRVVYNKLLERDEIINPIKYYVQLDLLKHELLKKRPYLANRKDVVFYQNNTKPYNALDSIQKLQCFMWKVIHFPAYSHDIASLDYHLFRLLQNSLEKNYSVERKMSKGFMANSSQNNSKISIRVT